MCSPKTLLSCADTEIFKEKINEIVNGLARCNVIELDRIWEDSYKKSSNLRNYDIIEPVFSLESSNDDEATQEDTDFINNWEIQTFLSFADFKLLSLYLSNAIPVTYENRLKSPPFISKQMKALDHSLSDYKKDSYISDLLKTSVKDIDMKSFENDEKLTSLTSFLHKTITWDAAEKFIINTMFECMKCADTDTDNQQIVQIACQSIKDLYAEVSDSIKTNMAFQDEAATEIDGRSFYLFKHAVIASLEALQAEVLRQLIEVSRAYTNLPVREKVGKGKNP